MKKLNRKGFTLIELLAVIVILAIVLVVTIPSVLRSISGAREQSLENAANSVADWLTRQSELSELAGTGVTTDTVDTNYTSLVGASGWAAATEKSKGVTLSDALLKAAGFGGGTTDATGKAWKSGNKICVELTATSTGRLQNAGSKTSAGC